MQTAWEEQGHRVSWRSSGRLPIGGEVMECVLQVLEVDRVQWAVDHSAAAGMQVSSGCNWYLRINYYYDLTNGT